MLYLFIVPETPFIRTIVSFCAVVGIGKLFVTDKKHNDEVRQKDKSHCILCGQDLYHQKRFLKFKNFTYICQNCMVKYRFSPINAAITWSANHTIEEFKQYLDKEQDFSDIVLEIYGNDSATSQQRNNRLYKSWYERLEIWLLIIIAFIIFITYPKINFLIKIIVTFLAALSIYSNYKSNKDADDEVVKRINAHCALCGHDLYYSNYFLKFKGPAYVCQDCMKKYKYGQFNNNIIEWAHSHTIDDLIESLNQGQNLAAISLELQRQKERRAQYLTAFKKNSVHYSNYYFNIDARKIYSTDFDRIIDASEIASCHINDKISVKTEDHFVTQSYTNHTIPIGKTEQKVTKYLEHLGLIITLTDNSEFEINFLIFKSKISSTRTVYAYSRLKQVISIIEKWHEEVVADQQEFNSTNDVITELIKYKQLLTDGIITQEEFDTKKKQLLNL